MAETSKSAKADQERVNGVAEIYNETAGTMERMCGEHIHHGYYEPGSAPASMSAHPAAQVRMIDEVLRSASVSVDPEKRPKSILDIGCGIGGTCLHLARKYGAQCKGIAISPVEVERAQALAAAQGLQGQVSFAVADALSLPFPEGQFDLIWCMETSEYIADKEKLVSEFVRVAAPGGTIILASWCHRDLSPSEKSMKPDEEMLIKKICDLNLFPPFCSSSDYIKLFKSHPLEDIKAEEWSQYASPTWPLLIGETFTIKGFISLLWTGGWKAVKLVTSVQTMMKAHQKGALKFAVISCRKPK